AQHDDITVGVRFVAIDANHMVHRAMLAGRALAGAWHMRRDEIVNRLAALQFPQRTRLEDAVGGEEPREFLKLAVIHVEAVGGHQIPDGFFFLEFCSHRPGLHRLYLKVTTGLTRTTIRCRPDRWRR